LDGSVSHNLTIIDICLSPFYNICLVDVVEIQCLITLSLALCFIFPLIKKI